MSVDVDKLLPVRPCVIASEIEVAIKAQMIIAKANIFMNIFNLHLFSALSVESSFLSSWA